MKIYKKQSFMIYERLMKILHVYIYINITYIYIIYIYTYQYIDTKKIYGALKSDCRICQMLLLHYPRYLTSVLAWRRYYRRVLLWMTSNICELSFQPHKLPNPSGYHLAFLACSGYSLQGHYLLFCNVMTAVKWGAVGVQVSDVMMSWFLSRY